MLNPTTHHAMSDAVPKSSPPLVWLGFLFAGAFLFIEIAYVILELDERAIGALLTLVLWAGVMYWMVCVYKIHKVLRELTHGAYPFSPIGAVLRHFVPFFNIYWLFKWPMELSQYLGRRVPMISGSLIGLLLLCSMFLRLFDGGIGMAMTFGVTMYISNQLRTYVKALKGVTPDQLPPLPDPRMFSRSMQTASVPAHGVMHDRRDESWRS